MKEGGDKGKGNGPTRQERVGLFYYLDALMAGRATLDQRARVERVDARLLMTPNEAMNAIIAVNEYYLYLLAVELADVSRQVQRGVLLAFAATLTACMLVFIPFTMYVSARSASHSTIDAAADARPDACAQGGQALCDSVAAIASDGAKAFLANKLAGMPPEAALSLARSQAGLDVWLGLGQLDESDRRTIATFVSQKTKAASP